MGYPFSQTPGSQEHIDGQEHTGGQEYTGSQEYASRQEYASSQEHAGGQEYAGVKAMSAPAPSDLSAGSAGIQFLTDFWAEHYLDEYISEGGSKIKFITGRPGSGKTHFLKLFTQLAAGRNYKVALFSAREVWLHDFREIYLEVLNQCGLMDTLAGCARTIIRGMGYNPEDIREGTTFMDYLSEQDMGDALTRREIRVQLKTMFLDNPLLDNNFALACSLLTGSILGHPVLEQQNRDLLLAWLHGDKTVKLSLLRSLGLSPSRITRYNARHMLRSLAEVIHLGGFSGLVISIDHLEILLNRSSLQPIHYTRMKREDTYESIRQLIDDIDSLKHIMFLFAFDRELLDNDLSGIKSYQALWMRIQNEIIGERFNRFADIVDLDRLAAQEYTPAVLVEMSQKMLSSAAARPGAHVLTTEEAEELIRRSATGGVGIPRLVKEAALGGEKDV